jgi:geranylgeranyl pyrophosphate synthase
VGLAFQIQDDILGMFGKTKITGKPVGNDFREGKKTILVIKAYENVNDEQKKMLSDNIGKELSSNKLEKVQAIIKESGALDYAVELAKDNALKGKRALEKLSSQIEQEAKTTLVELADFLVEREF